MRLGLIVPATPGEFELEHLETFSGSWLQVRITWHPTTDRHAVDDLRADGSKVVLVSAAEELVVFEPQAVAYACTSASFVNGLVAAQQQVEAIGGVLGVPATSTSLAFVRALQAMGNPTVAVAASYPSIVAERFVGFLEEAGIRTVNLSVGDAATGADANQLDGKAVRVLIAQADCAEADAILVPDTAINTLAYLADLEVVFGKPVLTANQVTLWDALRLAEALRPLPRLGHLLAEPLCLSPSMRI